MTAERAAADRDAGPWTSKKTTRTPLRFRWGNAAIAGRYTYRQDPAAHARYRGVPHLRSSGVKKLVCVPRRAAPEENFKKLSGDGGSPPFGAGGPAGYNGL